jgi:uncharacterized protein GlcG (DUF336 family)
MPPLMLEALEDRYLLDVSAVLAAGALTITGMPNAINRIDVTLDTATNQIVVLDFGVERGRFDSAAVNSITVNAAGQSNEVHIGSNVLQPAILQGGPGLNRLFAGGGPTNLIAGPGANRLVGGPGNDVLDASQGTNTVFGDGGTNTILAGGKNTYFGNANTDSLVGTRSAVDRDFRSGAAPAPNLDDFLGLTPSPPTTITAGEVGQLLQRAAAATPSDNAIVAIVDRGGRILGVRVEGNVSPAITGNPATLTFAIDGAVAEARTGAFFGNNQAPLTSRTIQFISQTTITQREVESNPSITDPNSTVRGPGTVGPIGIAGHFPPGVPFTPQVDLFGIENTNRDTTVNPGPDQIKGTADDVRLAERFNVNPAFIPSRIPVNQQIVPPDSYGFASGLQPNAQPRGIGTLPGGIPIVKNGVVVGGIGVFFPGQTGYADEENSALSSNFDPKKRDLSFEAEFIAYAALGGSSSAGFPIGTLGGVAPLPGFDLPSGRIDLVGITLPVFGPGGTEGPANLIRFGQTLGIGQGDPNSGVNEPLLNPGPDGKLGDADDTPAANNLLDGTPVPEGWLVTPHNGVGISADDVRQMIAQGVNQAQITRAAIRLPLDSLTRMVFAVTDQTGEVLGLFRMPDATIFSIDVAVAKARNVAYYADPMALQQVDQVPGVPAGTAFTNRTFRYLALPRFPEGIDGQPPGPFSILNDPGTDPNTGLNVGPPQPASAFQSVFGHDAFNPQTNFRQKNTIPNQNGIVFFPGSAPLYKNGALVGGVGISGDGVDQDDVVTFSTATGFGVPANVLRADQAFFNGVRLPYQKFNRQPLEP